MMDFEVAAHNAVRTSSPQSSSSTILNAYGGNYKPRRLVVMCKADDEFRRLVRIAAVLPLVPENSVEDLWFQALEDNQDDNPHVVRFKDYMTKTWVEGHLQHWNHGRAKNNERS